MVGSLSYARHYLQDYSAAPRGKCSPSFWVGSPAFILGSFCAPGFLVGTPLSTGNSWWAKNLGWLVVAGVPLAYLGTVATQILGVILQILFQGSSNVTWQIQLPEVGVHLVLYWTTVGGAYVIRSRIQLHDREQQAAQLALEKSQLESTLRQAELETLRARLNPHFLFNCLQNISVLTREDPQSASQMLARLGVLLRTALRGMEHRRQPLPRRLP